MEAKKKSRISWDEYFMKIAYAASERSTCLSAHKGAVIIKDKRIIATGYSGAPKGIKNCAYDYGFCRKRQLGFGHGQGHDECLAVHAEANAILQAAALGISCKDTTMYCTHKPCAECAKLIINAGISVVIYDDFYPSQLADNLLDEAGVQLRRFVWDFEN